MEIQRSAIRIHSNYRDNFLSLTPLFACLLCTLAFLFPIRDLLNSKYQGAGIEKWLSSFPYHLYAHGNKGNTHTPNRITKDTQKTTRI